MGRRSVVVVVRGEHEGKQQYWKQHWQSSDLCVTFSVTESNSVTVTLVSRDEWALPALLASQLNSFTAACYVFEQQSSTVLSLGSFFSSITLASVEGSVRTALLSTLRYSHTIRTLRYILYDVSIF